MIEEIRALNLSMYISEAASACAETKIKLGDVNAAVAVFSELHQRYADFGPQFLPAFFKQPGNTVGAVRAQAAPAAGPVDADEWLSRFRVLLRIHGELLISGLLTDDGALLLETARRLVAVDSMNASQSDVLSANPPPFTLPPAFVSFLQHCGDCLLGSASRAAQALQSAPAAHPSPSGESAPIVSASQAAELRNLCVSYYKDAAKYLERLRSTARKVLRRNREMELLKGELPASRKEQMEQVQKRLDKLHSSLLLLAEQLGCDPPVAPDDTEGTDMPGEVASALVVVCGNTAPANDDAASDARFEDEDMRRFYESLVDLKAILPPVVLGAKTATATERPSSTAPGPAGEPSSGSASAHPTEPASTPTAGPAPDAGKDAADRQGCSGDTAERLAAEKSLDDLVAGSQNDAEMETLVSAMDRQDLDAEAHGDSAMPSLAVTGRGPAPAAALSGSLVGRPWQGATDINALLDRLPMCISRDLIDRLAEEFCYVNTKSNRKRLIDTLFAAPRSRLDLIPYYARMIATLHVVLPEIGQSICDMLEREFRLLYRRNQSYYSEAYVRNIRYIGELVKFNVYPKASALGLIRGLIHQFTPLAVEMLSLLLESCGRYLFRTPVTQAPMGSLLGMIKRKMATQHVDSQLQGMLESAIAACDPPSVKRIERPPQPPLQAYICKLLYVDMRRSSVEMVLRQLRKLPWNDNDIAEFAIAQLSFAHRVSYAAIDCLASVVAGLAEYYPHAATRIVDNCLEEIRLGLELNDQGWSQRRIAYARYLGELYAYYLCSERVVFDVLYSMLFFGNSAPDGPPTADPPLDPRHNYFCIRLVCTLLSTCGRYFTQGPFAERLNAFLAYFQRYVLAKQQPLPADIELLYMDLLEWLRPGAVVHRSYEAAAEAVRELEKQLHARCTRLGLASLLQVSTVPTGGPAADAGTQPPSTDPHTAGTGPADGAGRSGTDARAQPVPALSRADPSDQVSAVAGADGRSAADTSAAPNRTASPRIGADRKVSDPRGSSDDNNDGEENDYGSDGDGTAGMSSTSSGDGSSSSSSDDEEEPDSGEDEEDAEEGVSADDGDAKTEESGDRGRDGSAQGAEGEQATYADDDDDKVRVLDDATKPQLSLEDIEAQERLQRDLERLVAESVDARRSESVKLDVALPVMQRSRDEPATGAGEGGVARVGRFALLSRKGNKPVLKEIDMQLAPAMVERIESTRRAERAERDAVKRVIMQSEHVSDAGPQRQLGGPLQPILQPTIERDAASTSAEKHHREHRSSRVRLRRPLPPAQ